MSVTVEQLAAYVGADPERDEDALTDALAVANALVGQALTDPWRAVPSTVFDECVKRAGYNLFKQGGSTESGMFNGADGQPVAGIANDPLQKCWILIKRYTNRV